MKKGAFDYLEKPFKVDDLRLCIQRALSYNDAISENIYLRKQLKKKYQFNQLIGNSPMMQDVFKMIERVADTDSTILILGESGTGKELVARALHFNSRRQFAPFIPINCSALPENLLESELFGHCKGAFTGAINDKKGLFQEADGGTIFLDEIGSMPPVLQSRLLRVLQEKEVRRVGDNVAVSVNVRVLAATNEPLEKRLKEGTFREDLYYRLNVIPINLPSLRERREDVPVLTMHFLRNKVNPRTGKFTASPAKRWRSSAPTTGPATCANWKTPSSAPAPCAKTAPSAWPICPRPPPLCFRRRQRRLGRNASPGLTVGGVSAPPPPSFSKPGCAISCASPPKPAGRSDAGRSVATVPQIGRPLACATRRPLTRGLSARTGTGLRQPRPGPNRRRQGKGRRMLGVSVATFYRKLAEEEERLATRC
jgi:hypothetical protein